MSANTAWFDERRKLAQEAHDAELERITEEYNLKREEMTKLMDTIEDLISRRESFTEGIDSLLEEVQGAGPGQQTG